VNVQPGAAFEAVIDTGEPGLAGLITVEANDNTGATAIIPTTLGVTEIAAGVYAATGLQAPDTAGQYTLIWKHAGAVLGIEDLVVTGSAPGEPVPPSDTYATTDELFRILKIRTPTADQTVAAQRVLEVAAGEINSKMGRLDGLAPWELQLCAEVNLERAVEHWSQQEVPFGVIGLDSPSGPTYLPRKSRALAKLLPLEQSWGVA
jgi:hypothetical protein